MIGFMGPLRRELALAALREAQLATQLLVMKMHIDGVETSRRARLNDLQDIKDHVQQCLMGSMHMAEGPGLTDYRKTLEALEATVSKKIALQKGIIVEESPSQADTRKMITKINEQLETPVNKQESDTDFCERCGE